MTPAKRAAVKKASPAKASPAKKAAVAKKVAPAKKAPPKPVAAKRAALKASAPVADTSTEELPPPAASETAPLLVDKAGEPTSVPVAIAEETENVAPGGTDVVAADSGGRAPGGGEAATPLRVVADQPDRRRFDSIGEQLLAEPARTPEILAHALVQALGPRARAWADHVRSTYPTASREALARLAVQRFTRSAGLRGGVGALAGPYAPVVIGAATVITHAELVLHLAAVHGLDPADPERAADLLRLVSPGVGPVVGWAALSLATPGVRLVAAFLSARTTTEMVAVRARRYYTEGQAG